MSLGQALRYDENIRSKRMKADTAEFYGLVLHNFIATCFGLSIKCLHQAKLEYQSKVFVQNT